jgi:non-ribosomal peptide synthetase component F
VIAEHVDVCLETVDFRNVPEDRRASLVNRRLDEEAATEFDLEHGPLFRATLLAVAENDHLLLFTAHHIAVNGWTISLTLEETASIYSAMVQGREHQLPEAVQFARYLEWEKEQAKAAAADEAYWAKQLSAPIAFELPASKPRGPVPTWRGARRTVHFEGEFLPQLRAAARQNGATLFMTLLAGWETLVGRLTGASRVAVWTPVSRQAAMGTHVLAGQCTRMFPVIAEFDETTTGAALVAQVKRALLDVYEHQRISLGAVRELRLPPAVTMFNLDRAPGLPKFEGIAVSLETAPIASAKYELSLNALEMGGRLILDFDYRADLFDASTVEAWIESFRTILRGLIEDVQKPVAALEIAPPQVERARPRSSEPVLAAFERNARMAPDRVALRAEGRAITYRELDEKSGRLAAALAAHGVKWGDGVGIEPGHPVDNLALRIALMKLGGVWMEPAHRSSSAMLHLCDHAAVVLSRGASVGMLPREAVLDLDRLERELAQNEPIAASVSVGPDELACSFQLDENTFACTASMLADQASAARELFGLREGDRIGVRGMPGIETIFGALTAAATVTLNENEAADVDIVIAPAWAARNLPSMAKARVVAFTDGPLSSASVARFEDAHEIFEICRPAGLPLLAAVGAKETMGCDRRGVLCRSVYLAGSPMPSIPGAVARWQLAGARGLCPTDSRVQVVEGAILWMTSEAGEVETALREVAEDAAVFALPQLVAYVVPPRGVTMPGVRAALAEVLPPELVPQSFAAMESIPAKLRLDPRALAELAGEMQTGREYTAPRNETEKKMCALWEAILEQRPIGVHDRFSDLGGQSLHAARLAARARQVFGTELSLADLLSAPTPGMLCGLMEGRPEAGEVPPIPTLPSAPDYELSRAQHRMWAMAEARPDSVGYNVPAAVLLEGRLDVETLRAALGDLASRHESLRTCFVDRDGMPRQAVREPVVELDVVVIVADGRVAVAEAATKLATRPFDLKAAPLWRARLLSFAPDRHGLALTFHHIVTDGWSIEVLARDLGALYAMRTGREAGLAPLPIQYRDYAAWENARAAADAAGLAWWRQRLAGIERLELPCDFVRETAGAAVATLRMPLGANLTKQFDSFCRARGITRFMGLAAVTSAILHRLSGASDIALGTPVAHRDHPMLESQAGLFVNTVVLRERAVAEHTFAELAHAMRGTCLDAIAHGRTPFDLVVDATGPHDPKRPPIFDAMVTFEENPRVPLHWGSVRVTAVDVPPVESLFDLNFRYQALQGEIALALDYRTGLFEPGRIELWAGRLMSLLREGLAWPDRRIDELDIRSGIEKPSRKRRGRAEVRL